MKGVIHNIICSDYKQKFISSRDELSFNFQSDARMTGPQNYLITNEATGHEPEINEIEEYSHAVAFCSAEQGSLYNQDLLILPQMIRPDVDDSPSLATSSENRLLDRCIFDVHPSSSRYW